MRLFRYFFYHKYCHIFMREQERTKLKRDYPSYRRILNVKSLKLFLKFFLRGQPSTFTSQFPFSTKTSTPWTLARRKIAAFKQLEMWTPPRFERNDPYRRFLPLCLAIVVQTSFVSIVCIHIIRAKTGHHLYKNNSRGRENFFHPFTHRSAAIVTFLHTLHQRYQRCCRIRKMSTRR